MSEPHVIRLRGPWQLEPVARFVPGASSGRREQTSDLPPGGKTDVPSVWAAALGPDFFGRVRYTRAFNCPTNLDPGERVWLVCDDVAGSGQFALNGQPIMSIARRDQRGSCDITTHLALHNTLVVEVTAEPADRVGGITGEVRLEIRRAARSSH